MLVVFWEYAVEMTHIPEIGARKPALIDTKFVSSSSQSVLETIVVKL